MTAQPVEGWIPEDSLADRLFLVRRKLGLSQREAAARTGVPYGSWQSMEDGRQARGVDVKITQISEALGVDRNWLMWGGPRPAPTGQNELVRTPEEVRTTDELPRRDSNLQPAGWRNMPVIAAFRTDIAPRRARHSAVHALPQTADATATTQTTLHRMFGRVCGTSEREVA